MSLTIIVGAMFSGKSITLNSYVENHHYVGKRCVTVRPALDNRYDDRTCNNGYKSAVVPIVTIPRLADLDVTQYDVIGVTEGQFFDDLLLVDDWAQQGKIIYCDGLSGDAKREVFGRMPELMCKADVIEHRRAECACGRPAAFTKKRTVNQPKNNGDKFSNENTPGQIDVGGAEKYEPACRSCH